jgi:hypothetical protein
MTGPPDVTAGEEPAGAGNDELACAVVDELAGAVGPLPIERLAFVVGGLRWVEMRGFEVLGRLATGPEEIAPAARVWASSASLAHAWRAAQLEALLPVSVGLPRAEKCTRAPGPLTAQWCGRLGLEQASSLQAVLAAAYARRAGDLRPGADDPVAGTLARLVADLVARAPFPRAS